MPANARALHRADDSDRGPDDAPDPGQARADGPDERRLPALSWPQTIGVLAIAVTQFLFGAGPIWRHPWTPDASIVYSYIPIPVMVLICLIYSKKLSIVALLFDSFRIALFKFGVTAFLLVSVWALTPVKPEDPFVAPTYDTSATAHTQGSAIEGSIVFVPEASEPRAPSALASADLTSVEGVVLHAGDPAAGALVIVASGLEGLDFAATTEPRVLDNDGTGFSEAGGGSGASVIALQMGQPIVARAGDHALHTLLGVDASGQTLFSVPVLGDGSRSRAVIFTQPLGPITVRCAVHPSKERELRAIVLSHPFATHADGNGAFRLQGVPKRKLSLSAITADWEASSDVDLTKGEAARVTLGK